jgi:HEAT repeat protein
MHYPFPVIDNFSFWLGVILSALLWWVISSIRPAFEHYRATIQEKLLQKKEKGSSLKGIEDRYRCRVLIESQGHHLAAPLFSLDEVLQPPNLIAPPPRVEPDIPLLRADVVSSSLPYLPSWPELAAIYYAPILTLSQALSGGSDIVLTGKPGMGKTVALAYLASRLARRELESGVPPDTVPILIHIADLDLPVQKSDPLNPIINAIIEKTPQRDRRRIPGFVQQIFTEGRAILLLDGTDELTSSGLNKTIDFIKALKRIFPKTRIITTGSIDFLDGLVTLNFTPYTLSPWNFRQRQNFLEKWGNLWTNFVAVETWAQNRDFVDPILINSWLNAENSNLTPLELTLLTWGSYAGDILGSRPLDAIETHLHRLSPANSSRQALELLALQITLNTEPIFELHKAQHWIKSFEPSEVAIAQETSAASNGRNFEKNRAPSNSLVLKMIESCLLSRHCNNRLRFTHPVFCGYLAGSGLVNYKSETLLDQSPWIGKYLAMQFLSIIGDPTPLVDKLISTSDPPLSRPLLTTARWLRDAPRQVAWRGRVMAKLVELLGQTGQPLGLRGQALCALVQSSDPSVAILLRQLLTENNHEILQLAALGSGAIQDIKSIELLSALLSNQPNNVRGAACLALVNIGTPAALDSVAASLLHGDESMRVTAAEALANHPREGFAMLKEAAGMKEDLLVRRSSVFGLSRVNEPWADELIDHLETEDDQWAVRTAATEVKESRTKPNPHIYRRLPPPTESPWIIAFAGQQGLGVSPDKPPIDLLLVALKSGTQEERMASLDYLRMMPAEGVFGALYHAMYGDDTNLRESVFQTFAEMASRGVIIPDPVQFGVGD